MKLYEIEKPARSAFNKKHKLLTKHEDIDMWLWKRHLSGARSSVKSTINEDGTVDIEGDVIISGAAQEKIEVQFGLVNGDFDISNNKLRSLYGCPHTVTGNFEAYHNMLGSLIDGPKIVGGNYDVTNNSLNNLNGCPDEISGHFSVEYNYLLNLQYGPRSVWQYTCDHNPINTIEWMPEIVLNDFTFCGGQVKSLVGIADKIKKIGDSLALDFSMIEEGGLGLLLIEGLQVVWDPNHSASFAMKDKGPFSIIAKYVEKPNKQNFLYECQTELIENGFEEYAKL